MGVPSNFGIVDWKSRAGQRVCRSTFSAETQACVEGVEAGQHVRALFETLLTGDLVKVEDSKIPLFCLSHKLPLGWVPSTHQLSDILTKPQDSTSWWETAKQKLLVPIVVTGGAPSCKRSHKVGKTSVNPYGVCDVSTAHPFEFCVGGGLP